MNEEFKEWAKAYARSSFPFILVPAVLVAIWYKNVVSVLICAGTGLLLMGCGVVSRGKTDRWLWGIVAFAFAVYFANWFFDDIKKTLAFPLAFICYAIGKKLSPSPLKPVLDSMENFYSLRLRPLSQNESPKNKRGNKNNCSHEKPRNISYRHAKNNRKIVRMTKRQREGL